jgi:hypothetical protein
MVEMALELILSFIAFGFITVGFVFYLIAMLMERHYDRKLWELERKYENETRNK